MNNAKETLDVTATQGYRRNFWNAMKGNADASIFVAEALGGKAEMYLPMECDEYMRKKEAEYGVVRSLATCFRLYGSAPVLWAYDFNDYTEFVGAGDLIPVSGTNDDFRKIRLKSHKAAGIAKVSTEFLHDAMFDLEHHLMNRAAKSLACTEDRAYIGGTGEKGPTGLLHDADGCETACVTRSISYDDCIGLFFSLKPEYRKNGVWMMNDRTALGLRKMKDTDGNYLWSQAEDTILGKRVVICNDMPDASEGNKPILFGDFSYYWIVDLSPVSFAPLHEVFACEGQTGYAVREYQDARLVRPEAVKAIKIG